MTTPQFNVGAFVWGAPNAPRALVSHAELLAAYADGEMLDRGESSEAYLSHFAFGADMRSHYSRNGRSVAEFSGPCWCRRLTLDVDRTDLGEALADTRRLVAHIYQRYPETDGDLLVYFSGGKGFHVDAELAHAPPPSVGFQHVARAFAEALAAGAGVRIDTGVYDVARLVRLPNTRHPRTGLFKRRIDAEALLRLDLAGVLEHAKRPAGDGTPSLRRCPANLAADWLAAERAVARAAAHRQEIRATTAGAADAKAPRYFMDFLRFGVEVGDRHLALFRCSAWLTEQGAPPSLCSALLTEAGRDNGLSPKEVERQIACGVEHARRQKGTLDEPPPCPDDFERWATEREANPLPPGALDFPFGSLGAEERGAA